MNSILDSLKRFFKNSETPILFAGAGVSARAGVVTWATLLKQLQESVRARDAYTANIMAESVHENDYLLAADYYFLTKKVPDGEKLQIISNALKQYDHDAILDLVRLPFQGFVTTNFDRCLNDAYAKAYGRSALDFRRGDDSFKQILWARDFFIARIHGSVEHPTSIILSGRHFEDLKADKIYQDILSDLFTKKNVLFVGCSFNDPAVKAIFDLINKQYGPTPPGLHMALLPDDADNDFVTRLNRFNIEIVRYDSSNRHELMWNALRSFCDESTAGLADQENAMQGSKLPFESAKRYLAACYARMRLNSNIHPLRQAVVEGMISALLQAYAPKGVSEQSLFDMVHKELGISNDSAKEIVSTVISQLQTEKLCLVNQANGTKTISWQGVVEDTNSFEGAIDILVIKAQDRAVVQEGMKPVSDLRAGLKEFFNQLILQRGWDLGASFALNKPLEDVDVGKLLFQSCSFLSTKEIEALIRVCNSMLSRPTQEEAEILTALGRISFALELTLQSPRNTLFHSEVLPEKVYLDANIMMPALTYGHPFHDVYKSTIKQLTLAASKTMSGVQIIAYYGFLNEVVSHKKLALDFYFANKDNFREMIRKEALYYGTSNMNVFIGAYANILRNEPNKEFEEYMNEHVPFKNESELSKWIMQKGIQVKSENEMKHTSYPKINFSLEKAYSSELASGKDVRLISHDAVQLSTIQSDLDSNKRVIFVTADKKLRDMLSKGDFAHLGDTMISNVGLAQMIDLLVGSDSEVRSMASLIWSTKSSNKAEEARQYLINLALNEYDEAMAMEMNSVVEEISEQMAYDAARRNIDIDSDNLNKRKEFITFAESYENSFFEALKTQIEKRRKQQGS